jgi:hypothetical protein
VTSHPTLTLVGKPDCHLCDVMAAVVAQVVGDRVGITKEDVRAKPEWARYRLEIPVLLWGDTEVARHRTTESDLRQKLAALGFEL